MQLLARAKRQVLVTYLLGACFGAIHLAPWNMHFVSTTDARLWRAAAIIATATPALSALSIIVGMMQDSVRETIRIMDSTDADDQQIFAHIPPNHLVKVKAQLKSLERSLHIIHKIMSGFGFPVFMIGYIPARVIIIVEMIRGLFFLIPETFEVVGWVTIIPHVS
jgi:hypothetical protein